MLGRLRKALCVVVVIIFVSSSLPAQANPSIELSDWFKSTPVISNNFDLPPGQAIPYSINGNRECIKQKIVTRPRKVLPYWPYIQHEQSHDSCIVNTGYGAVSQSGYLQVPGENTFGTVHYPWGKKMNLFAVPNASGAIYIEPNLPNGVTMTLIPDFLANISATTLANGEITFTVKEGTPIRPLKGPDNKPVGVISTSASFSFGGRWMVADIPYLGLSRIDTETMTIKTFGSFFFNYNIGVDPGVHSAVTASGRYAIISSSSFTFFKLYDLEDCSDNKNCRSLNLQDYFKTVMPGFLGAYRLRFGSDHSVRMYAHHQPPGKPKTITSLTLRAFGHEAVGFEYLALGDSFASGEGAFQYKAITDTDDNECHLSLRSYPYLIGTHLKMNSYESVACSGAVLNDINDYDKKYPDEPQSRGMKEKEFSDKIYADFLPGYRQQQEFLAEYSPDIISLSISGNDIGFSDKLKKCLMPGTCYKYYEDRMEAAFEVNNQFGRLSQLYSDIKTLMPNKKVYIIGYPEITYEGGICYGNVYLDGEEVKFANQLVRHLNGMVKAAADKTGFYYVDVEKAFVGHRLCETDYPNVAINGITAGDDTNIPFTHIDLGGPIGNESFHPNDLGHRKLKDMILNKTSDFTASMPAPNESATPPEVSSDMELLKDAPHKFRKVRYAKLLHKEVQSEVLRNEEIKGTIKLTDSGFKPSSEVEVWMHSEPIKLQTANTDESGNLKLDFKIPGDTPYGFHTIHIYGTSITGAEIDLNRVVQVIKEPIAETGENDNTTQPDSNETEKMPVSNEDPKPPENNPETEAGHEQTNSEQKIPEIVGNTDNQAVQQAATANPYFVPGTAITEGQVAAAQTIAATPVKQTDNSDESQRAPVNTIYLWLLPGLPIMLVLVVGVIYPFRKDS